MGFYLLVETSFHPEKVADGGNRQVHDKRVRGNGECVIHVTERQLIAISGQQHRKEDGMGLDERGADSCINSGGRKSY